MARCLEIQIWINWLPFSVSLFFPKKKFVEKLTLWYLYLVKNEKMKRSGRSSSSHWNHSTLHHFNIKDRLLMALLLSIDNREREKPGRFEYGDNDERPIIIRDVTKLGWPFSINWSCCCCCGCCPGALPPLIQIWIAIKIYFQEE